MRPSNPAILDTSACCSWKRATPRAASRCCRRRPTLAPNAAAIRLNLARALVKDGQKDAARKELDTLAKLGDKFAGQAEVAKLRSEFPVSPEVAKEREEAARDVERLQKAVAAAPNTAAMRLKLAQALIRAGQPAAARKELETLAKLGDKFEGQAEVAKLMQSL